MWSPFYCCQIFLPFYLFCFTAWPIAPLPCLSFCLFVFLSLCCSTLHDTFSVRTLWAGHICCKINMITTFVFHLLITADYSTWHCLDFQSSDIPTYWAAGTAKILQRSDSMSEKSRFLMFVTFFWRLFAANSICFLTYLCLLQNVFWGESKLSYL